MKNFKGTTIAICILVVLVIVEGILLISGEFTQIPKNANGEDILVSLNDGTNYTVDDIYKELKSSSLNTILDLVDTKILTTEYKDKLNEVEEYVKNVKANLKANYTSDKELEEALQNYGYNSIDEYLDLVRTNQLTTYATEDYAKSLLTEDEIKKYYDENVYAEMSARHIPRLN